MKKLLLSAGLLYIALASFAQQNVKDVDMAQLNKLKQQGKLTGKEKFINTGKHNPVKISPNTPVVASSSCNCWFPRDSSWSVCAFDGSGGNGGPGVPPDYRNDDWSTNLINLPFSLCFYGTPINQLYINNNGNISIGSPYSTFTANSFPDPTFVMIAPFWGDVDTRGALSGIVYYKLTPTHLIVQWDSVGYFNMYDDKVNTFQLVVTNGSDPILPNGNNVSFCYKDMQWTTGDASGGVNGFGGTPATVGVNQGNGVDYIQIGLYDQAGTAYDGPYGANDGVSMLDNQSFYFNICVTGTTNVPPLINSAQVCDTITLCVGDTFMISANYLSPEQGQITTPGFNANGMQGVTVINTQSGNTATILVQIIASSQNTGYNTVYLTGTDNGTPNQTSSSPIVIHVLPSPTINFSFSPSIPATPGTPIQFTDLTTNGTTCFWDFGDGSPISTVGNPVHSFAVDGTYLVKHVCCNSLGCCDTLVKEIKTRLPIEVPNVITPNGDNVNDSLSFKHLDEYPESRIAIYNRWGNKIYENADYKNDWTGKDQSDGTYYFVLTLPTGDVYKGYFEILRHK